MKRAIVLLSSAAFLGIGCGHTCDFRDVDVFWHFPSPAGSTELTCDQLGVAAIRVSVDGAVVDTVQCLDASGRPAIGDPLIDFADANYQFQVDALDASGLTLYSSGPTTFRPRVCGANRFDLNLVAAGGDMVIAYSFTDSPACTTPRSGRSPYGTTFIWFSLTGPGGQAYDVVNRSVLPTDIACGSEGAEIFFPNAPLGTYTLNGIEEVEILPDGTPIVYHLNCVPTALAHGAPGDTFPVPLAPQQTGGTFSCPGL